MKRTYLIQWVAMVSVLLLAFGLLSISATAHAESNIMELKVALLPIPDVLPFHLAQANGYFIEAGIDVKAISVASPIDRDQLMQAGEIDGMLTELTTTAYFNRDKVQVKIVRIARSPIGNHPLFRILSAPGSGITKPSDLAGVPIGISKNTIIEYVTDRLLMANGLRTDEIKKKSVPVIPERYQLLMQGQIKAATLPDPLASSALAAGAIEVIEDTAHPELSVSVLSFSTASLESKGTAIEAFLKAWDRAAVEINKAPDAQRELLLKKIRVPKNVQASFAIPLFPVRKVPSEKQWADVMDWMITRGLLKNPLPYAGSVSKR